MDVVSGLIGEPSFKNQSRLIVSLENNSCKVEVGKPKIKPTGLDCEPDKIIKIVEFSSGLLEEWM